MPTPHDGVLKNQPVVPEWLTRPERSNALTMRFMAKTALLIGRPAARLFLLPICLYFLIFSADARAASKKYLGKVLGRKPGFTDVFRHYHAFASTILDRVFLLNDEFGALDVRVQGKEMVDEIVAKGTGCFLLGAHMGSFEILRSLSREKNGPRVSLVMYEENARKINSVLEAINPSLSLSIIPLGKISSMLKVEEALDRGDFVGMLGDRTIIANEGTIPHMFLGEQATLPISPFRLAMMLKRPVVMMFGLYRGGNRYDLYFERLTDIEQADRVQRDLILQRSLDRYIQRVEHYCHLYPYNWFNFYDFWR